MSEKILLLGSGELGLELTNAFKELGKEVVAVDNYANAPAMQVADHSEVANLSDPKALKALVSQYKPDIIIPEKETVNAASLQEFEKQGLFVPPGAKAHEFATNRKAMRHLAAKVLKLRTPNYLYASNLDELILCVSRIGIPCMVKSLNSSSGKGQSLIKEQTDIEPAWLAASRQSGENKLMLVEQYISFESEITLLAITQKSGPTLFCPPIGHLQKRGAYQESWQPALVAAHQLEEVKEMAQKITWALGGPGLWGVEFFLTTEKVYFNEVSPRPHDTGLVTLAGTQNLNQFQLYVKAILGQPIPDINLEKAGASAVILTESSDTAPQYRGLEAVKEIPNAEVKIFGKPKTRPYRRMGVAFTHGDKEEDMTKLRKRAREVAKAVRVE